MGHADLVLVGIQKAGSADLDYGQPEHGDRDCAGIMARSHSG
jgi:hypothetical protein